MVTKIGVLANCQGQPLANLINSCLDGFTASYLSNNARTGQFTSAEDAFDALAAFDIIVYHPLDISHGAIASDAIRQRYGDKPLFRFAYIFNSGMTSLGYAPGSPRNKYGEVFGESAIIEMIGEGCSEERIADRVAEGDFLPQLPARFSHDLAIMAQRESALELKLCDFIEENFREKYLFDTHNHPSFELSAALLRRLVAEIAPRQLSAVDDRLLRVEPSVASLPYTGVPISPYDVRAHGYRFGYHSDWRQKQRHLINLVYRCHAKGEDVAPRMYASNIRFPDAA